MRITTFIALAFAGVCFAQPVWRGGIDAAGATQSRPFGSAAVDPARCTKGYYYQNTTTGKLRKCTATDTWADADGSSLPSITDTGSAVTISTPLAVTGPLSVGTRVTLAGTGDIAAAINTKVSACSNGCVIDASGYVPSGGSTATIALSKPLTLILPAGNITSSASPAISITSDSVTLRGSGTSFFNNKNTIITETNASNHVIDIGTSVALHDIVLSDFSVTGGLNGINVTPTAPNYVSQLRIEGVSANACAADGIKWTNVYNSKIRDSWANHNGGRGLALIGATYGSNSESTIDNFYTLANTGHQIDIQYTQGVSLRDVTMALGTTSGKYGLHITQSTRITLYDPWFEANSYGQMLIESVVGFSIYGGHIDQSGTSKGMVLAFDAGPNPNSNFWIDVPGWINSSSATRIDTSVHSAVISNIVLVRHLTGFFSTADLTGYLSNFPSELEFIFFSNIRQKLVTTTTTSTSNSYIYGSYQALYLNNSTGVTQYTLPDAAQVGAGAQYCVRNAVTRTGAITVTARASTFIDLNGVNTAAAGSVVSGGALADEACFTSSSTTQWIASVRKGTWTIVP